MKEERQEKLKISNDLLDAMLVGGQNARRFMGQRGHHHSDKQGSVGTNP